MNRRSILFIIIILTVAALLRILGLGFGLPDKQYIFSYSSDENQYLKAIGRMSFAKLDFNPHYFNWGTWHYYELAASILSADFLGFVSANHSKDFYHAHPEEYAKVVLAGRLLSVIYGLATIILIFYVGRIFFGPSVGLLSTLFLSLSPAHIIQSIFLKADTAVTFWILLMLFSALKILTAETKTRYYYLAGVSSGFALGTQWIALPFIHIPLAAHFLKNFAQKRWFHTLFDKKILLTYFAMALIYAVICPYSWLSAHEFLQGIKNIITGTGGGINNIVLPNRFFDTLNILSISITYPVLALLIAGFIFSVYKLKNRKIMLCFIWLFPLTYIILKNGYLIPRYFLPILPGFYLLGAYFILKAYAKIKRFSLANKIFITGAILNNLVYASGITAILHRNEKVQNSASDWIRANIPSGAKIGTLTNPEIRFVPTVIHNNYYYDCDDILNKSKSCYNIVSIHDSIKILEQENPRYFILSNQQCFRFEYPRFMNMEKDSPVVREYLEKNYKIIQKFPFDLKVNFWLMHLDYRRLLISGLSEFLPTFYILEKTD